MSQRDADYVLPEFTRPLRALGSARWLRDPDHARFFAPLLAARRNAARVRSAEGHVAAFQADRLRRALTDAVEQMALARHPRSAPDRRAFAARVTDAGSAVWSALDTMELRAVAVGKASASARHAAWREWVDALQQLFLAADAWWPAIIALRDGGRDGGRGGAVADALRTLAIALLLAAVPASLAAQQHLTYRVAGVAPDTLRARGFDVVGVENGTALVVAEPGELSRLQALGGQAQLRLAPGTDSRRLQNLLAVAATPVVYRSYDDPQRGIRAWIDSLSRVNARVSVDTVGRSYEGRPILAVKIGPRGDVASRPNVLFVATHHAREWAATEMALRLIRRLATATDVRTDSLVNQRDIWVVPVVNPDGYQYTFTNDRLWRKNRRRTADGAVGVDLNRNHSAHWGLDDNGSSPNPQSEIYRGSSAASEPEVLALQQFHALHPPVISVSYHTYAGLLLFPPGAVYGNIAADIDAYRVLAGTNARSAAVDRLPGSHRSFYAPSTAWMLYPTNGEYTDWASSTFGAVSITPELSSGYGPAGYYGFEFPDDDALLQQLYTDNLPFALDAIEMARDPAAYSSPSTGLRAERLVLESATTRLRVRVPAGLATSATLSAAGVPVTVSVDSAAGGKYSRRLVSLGATDGRPATITVTAGAQKATWLQLTTAGAEAGDPAWGMQNVGVDTVLRFAGRASYHTSGGELRSTAVKVPADVDTVSITFWTRYAGDGFSESPFGLVRLSADSGRTWNVITRLAGTAVAWYPEDVRVGGVHGQSILLSFLTDALPWWIDEVAVFANSRPANTGPGGGSAASRFKPSANPVRGTSVTFVWPFGGKGGNVMAYDFTGRLIFRRAVSASDDDVTWDLSGAAIPNGAYLVLAESGTERVRLRLFILRGAP